MFVWLPLVVDWANAALTREGVSTTRPGFDAKPEYMTKKVASTGAVNDKRVLTTRGSYEVDEKANGPAMHYKGKWGQLGRWNQKANNRRNYDLVAKSPPVPPPDG